ncbi:DUF7338 family protein [Neptuniibacter halophilus]|uniref:DUF7338 family protein n=1 Tax=Neptuniibacter halophilus TaxID=651666 RepID=UPI0025736469|nr:hypothetical protein [Neptuniibacter halophilus]
MRLLKYVLQLIFIDCILLNLLPALILIPAGFFLIPIAMCWRYEAEPKAGHPVHQAHWRYIRLPKWALIWEGENGLMGDGTRIHSAPDIDGDDIPDPGSWWAMYCWAAFRNPLGGWDRLVSGFHLNATDMIKYYGAFEVDDVSGRYGWQMVITHGQRRTVTGFYWVVRISSGKCFRLRMGYKVKPSYKGKARLIDATPMSVSIKSVSRAFS